jgi:hypothetical protein
MLIHLALEDGFDGDTVVLRIGDAEVYRGERVTTRTQISRAAEVQLDAPDGAFALEVEVPTQRVHANVLVDPHSQTNVALSLRDGRLVATFPERLGFA